MTKSAPADPPRWPWAQTALAALGVLLLATLTLAPEGATRQLLWPWWGAWRVALAVPPLLLALDLFARRRVAATPVAVLAALLAAVHGLAALLGPHPHPSLGAAATPLSAACLVVWLAGRLDDPPAFAARLARGLGGFALVFAAVSLASWAATRLLPLHERLAALDELAGEALFVASPEATRNDRPLGHSNYTAGLALLALPWLAALALATRGARRALWAAGGLLVAGLLVSSGSRGAILGIAAGAGFVVAALALRRRWRPRRIVAALAGAGLLTALLVAANPRARASLAAFAAGEGLHGGDQQRAAMLRVGWELGAQRPWIGHGPGLTPRLYPALRHEVDGGVDTALQLHGAPVQLWADTGAPGVVLAALLLGAALLASLRAADPWKPAAGASLAAYAGLALTDHQLDVPAFAALAAINLAFLARGRSAGPPLPAPAVLALPLAALAALLIPGVSEFRARGAVAAAVSDLERGGDPGAFDAAMRRAAELVPRDPHLPAGAAAAHLRLALVADTPPDRLRHREAAERFLEAALLREPDLEFAHLNLGWLRLGREPAAAAAHFAEAARLVPDRGGVYFGLGLARLEAGDPAGATRAFALELLNDPIFISGPAWDAPALAPHLEPAVREAAALADALAPGFAPAAETARLFRWWLGGDEPPAALREAAPAARFAPATDPLAMLRTVLAAPPEARRGLLGRLLLVRTHAAPREEEVEVLLRLLERHGDDWRGWLRAPEGREPPFLRTSVNERPAYAMLAGNMDLPVPVDARLVQENRLVELLFRPIIPPKGHVPDAFLLRHVAPRQP